ncbi:TetR family transcriptional regulator [Pectobacterium cacticida]|uniref:TetR/AcrR family transcriptional regulator n=1 Tax=Pectobacterium cacticida TaxID=69221 RepID=A0ABZ2GDU9_9GAMM|nr:TetR/AcrR family transcriptional regulator [Pectobacterium cacticida]UYX06588.1 TetR family transcriptional regulator [Pectobacterium cacticida]
MMVKKRGERLSQGEAYQRILEAAEPLFAERNPELVSFRDLASAAGVSLSAINYHFGTRQALFRQIFLRRARIQTERRLAYLEQLKREGREKDIEAIIEAFIRPVFNVQPGDKNDLFNKMRARLVADASPDSHATLREAYDDNDRLFIEALAGALPHLSLKDIYWRFHFLVGSMIYTMSDFGQLEESSGGICSPVNSEESIHYMIHTFSAALRAPSTTIAE